MTPSILRLRFASLHFAAWMSFELFLSKPKGDDDREGVLASWLDGARVCRREAFLKAGRSKLS
jgi:hypothetical protein